MSRCWCGQDVDPGKYRTHMLTCPGPPFLPLVQCPHCALACETAERLAEHVARWHP